MENESLSAQIVKLQIINTKFKARILELEAQLAEEKQRTFVQYKRAVGFSALNATLEARLKEAEEKRDEYAFNAALYKEDLGEARADAGRLRALILSAKAKLCPLPTLSCLRLFDEQGKDLRCTYCQVAQDDAAALSPAEQAKEGPVGGRFGEVYDYDDCAAEQADDEKGVKG